MAEAVCRI